MRNHEVIEPRDLLDERGDLAEPGWSRHLVQRYDRSKIQAPRWRIKEWDYYLVMGRDFAGAFTISDDGYIGLQSVSLLGLGDKPWEHTETVLNTFPLGKLKLPASSASGETVYEDKRIQMRFSAGAGERRITCHFERFPQTDFGTLDWGRGVWTYDNTWFWGSGNCDLDGVPFGFNIGYGFGNTSAATENVIFYDGKVHKLDDITFHIPEDSYTKPWTFTSSDGRFEMDFVPILDRAAKIDFKVLVSDQHQVFGRMSGKAVLDDGTVLTIKDVLCFAEKVHNRY